jgi:hypothetical protein
MLSIAMFVKSNTVHEDVPTQSKVIHWEYVDVNNKHLLNLLPFF